MQIAALAGEYAGDREACPFDAPVMRTCLSVKLSCDVRLQTGKHGKYTNCIPDGPLLSERGNKVHKVFSQQVRMVAHGAVRALPSCATIASITPPCSLMVSAIRFGMRVTRRR